MQHVTPERIDNSVPPGDITIDSTSVMRNGERWFPVMGEYHFSRDQPSRWARELRKMRAGGVEIVSTYLFWIHHEETRGERSWDDHLDIRAFVEAARDAGLNVVIRIGPWCHGEARNGGFPDWLQRMDIPHRTNDPSYLALVKDWYGDIARELQGLFRTEATPNAPIIGVQVDNELYDQPDHLGTLRDLAEESGMSAPLWVATGWGGAQVPLDRMAPVYAGYPDAFWEEADVDWPAFGPMHFRFSDVRDDLSVGADVRGDSSVGLGGDDRRYPFLTCELGGGMSVAYHRRPRVDPEDVSALALTKIGSGSAWQGYYLYHGTTQVAGARSGTQESHESGYPNDMPVREYDYYSPLGPSGKTRPHYHLLRRQHLFLEAWGAELTELDAQYAPDQDARWVIRADDQHGYVFVNNHQPAARPLPPLDGVRFSAPLAGHDVRLPTGRVTIPSSGHFVWPLRQRYGDADALTGTVQPLTRIDTADGLVVFFAATPGIPVELQIESSHAVIGARQVSTRSGDYWVPEQTPGPGCVVTVGTTRLVILDESSANALWRVELEGQPIVVLWDGALTVSAGHLLLERWGTSTSVLCLPALHGSAPTDRPFHRLPLGAGSDPFTLPIAEISVATGSPPTRHGGSMGRLSAPTEADFAMSAVYEIVIPPRESDGPGVLSLDWRGDVARAYIGDELVADQFWYGRPWQLDVDQWHDRLVSAPLRIEILPWNGQSRFFVDSRVRDELSPGVASIDRAILERPDVVVCRLP